MVANFEPRVPPPNLITVENFVRYRVPQEIKILFITENCPNLDNYFYRTLCDDYIARGNYNLLNNLYKCLYGLRVEKNMEADGVQRNEREKLDWFVSRGYFLIDTHPNGIPLDRNNPHALTDICNDISFLRPAQIVFTCIGSNGPLYGHIRNGLEFRLQDNIITPGIYEGANPHAANVFCSPSNRQYDNFCQQITRTIQDGKLTL